MLTERVPILPAFNPSHFLGGKPDTEVVDTTFGEVFDVPRLAKELRMPILEWWQVKDRKSTTVDSLGCWNVWQAVMENTSGPQYSATPGKVKIGEPTWDILHRVRSHCIHQIFHGRLLRSWSSSNLRKPTMRTRSSPASWPSRFRSSAIAISERLQNPLSSACPCLQTSSFCASTTCITPPTSRCSQHISDPPRDQQQPTGTRI